jgi:DNA-binding beta-propeller fold protein YncE
LHTARESRTIVAEESPMTVVGSGSYRYEVIETWGTLPTGWTFGPMSAVATDSQDRVYAFQRKDPPVLVFDKNGTFLTSWGASAIADPHGINIMNDVVYITDRDDHVALKYTLDGKPLMVLGTRGQPSDTGATKDTELPPRSAGPFNKPTEMMVAPSGDLYVSDGYRNSRVHRFSSEGVLLDSWGKPGKEEPGEFHLPHSLWVDRGGQVYVCDRENSRIQVFTGAGRFLAQWRDIHKPTDIYFDAQEIAYVSEQRPSISVLEKTGKVLARFDTAGSGHGLWVDSRGDIYLAQVGGKRLSKYVRVR